jgi:hypothetical protein
MKPLIVQDEGDSIMGNENRMLGIGPNSAMRHGFETQVTKALAGVDQYLPAATTLVLNERSVTQSEIVKELRDLLQLFEDLRSARTRARTQLHAVRNEVVRARALYTALERAMTAYFGRGNPKLAQFGYALGLREPMTAATSVKAQARAQLTRALRHTMGPRQKALLQSTAPSTVTVGPDGTVQAVAASEKP